MIEKEISPKALKSRDRLANSRLADMLLPVHYVDRHSTIHRLREHLASGHRAVIISTHPSLEDSLRGLRLFFSLEGISQSVMGAPAAVHQKKLVELITRPYDVRSSYLVTDRTKEKAKARGKKVSRDKELVLLMAYREFIKQLGNPSLLIAAYAADQAPKLMPPEKPVVSFILTTLNKVHETNVLFIPLGIEIQGITDYQRARNISLARHPYIFHFGPAFLDSELRQTADLHGITPDEVMYQQLRLVSPKGYLLE